MKTRYVAKVVRMNGDPLKEKELIIEDENNKSLSDSQWVVKCIGTEWNCVNSPYTLVSTGETMEGYHFMLIPLCKNNTLLDLLMKTIKDRQSLSLSSQGYLCK